MTLDSAVAASFLPFSRIRVASFFKMHGHEAGALEALARDSGVPPDATGAAVETARREAAAALTRARACGLEPIPLGDPRYPALLAVIEAPPPVLWVRGDPAILSRPTVAVVGSRAATAYAREVSQRLSFELAERGIVVVSGLARGVDSSGHQGALAARGATVAVLGSGLDRVYPSEHAGLAEAIARNGALVGELGPGAPPLPEHFPLRNRIISGISLAVVVVEASDRSGSLITARCALDQGRDVMAVPGSVLSGRNAGSHRLLKDGAKVVERADDILDELGWPSAGAACQGRGAPETDPLLSRMDAGETYRLEELMALTGLPGTRLLPRLMELELQGRVAGSATGGFTRVAGR